MQRLKAARAKPEPEPKPLGRGSAARLSDVPPGGQADRTRSSPSYVVWILVGASIGIAAASLVAVRLRSNGPTADETHPLANELLVSQQLDQLFKSIETIVEKGVPVESLGNLLNVYLIHDQRFVNRNAHDPNFRLQTAVALVRLGHCNRFIGDLPQSRARFQEAKSMLRRLVADDPTVALLFHDLLSTHVQIALIDQETGNLHACAAEFDLALTAIAESQVPESSQTAYYLVPLYKQLAVLGVELGRHRDALLIAKKFDAGSRRLWEESPHDEERARQAADSKDLVDKLGQYVQRVPS